MKEESDLRQKVHDEIQYVEWSCEQRGIEGKDRTGQHRKCMELFQLNDSNS